VRGCLWCLDGPGGAERQVLDQLGTVAADRGVEVDDLLPELRATFARARAAHDQRTEHYAWAAIRAITALTPTGETGVSLSDAAPLRVLAVSGVA